MQRKNPFGLEYVLNGRDKNEEFSMIHFIKYFFRIHFIVLVKTDW